ncbi:hypothetical protein KC460_05185 [Candidatus Dependentiae bacterium]|nr:hypothetical protein [Candidatus Dependentiae bacterium]
MSLKHSSSTLLEPQEQLVISYELLCLLHWFMEHDNAKFRRMLKTALKKGLYKKIVNKQDLEQFKTLENIQHTILDFFGMLEALFIEAFSEYETEQIAQKSILPELDHIDSKHYDDSEIHLSAQKAQKDATDNPAQLAKDILFQELLRRWQPKKKTVVN